MAESLDDGEFWLPPQFLDDDVFLDQNIDFTLPQSKSRSLSFPLEFGTMAFFSDFTSPNESLKGLSETETETESDEDDYLSNLSLHMAHSTIDDSKGRVVSGSPQSILSDLGSGSGSGCSQGSSRGSPKSQSKVSPSSSSSSSPATWDLLHAAAGEVAKFSDPVLKSDSSNGFYSHMQFQNMQHQVNHGGFRNGLSASGPAPWLPPTQQQRYGMRALFLGNSASKRECTGTGVFLPRHVGNQSEPRKKPACSTVLVPARVIQALNLNLDDICNQPHVQPVAAGRFNSKNDVLLRLQSNRNGVAAHPRRNNRRQPVMEQEIKLPQEWTY